MNIKSLIALSLLSLNGFAYDIASNLKAEISMRNRSGNNINMAQIRLTSYHRSAANILNASECQFQIGKDDILSLGVPSITYNCLYTGNEIIIAQEAVFDIVERSRNYSLILFDDSSDYDQLISRMIEHKGSISGVDRYSGNITKVIKDLASKLLNVSGIVVLPIHQQSEFTLNAGDIRTINLKITPQE